MKYALKLLEGTEVWKLSIVSILIRYEDEEIDQEFLKVTGIDGTTNNHKDKRRLYRSNEGYTWSFINDIENNKIKNHIKEDYFIDDETSNFINKDFLKRNDLKSVISLPIENRENIYGVINAFSRNRQRINTDEKNILRNIARLSSIEISNIKLQKSRDKLNDSLLELGSFNNAAFVTLGLSHDIKHRLLELKYNLFSLMPFISSRIEENDPKHLIISEVDASVENISGVFGKLIKFNSKNKIKKFHGLENLIKDVEIIFSNTLNREKIDFKYQIENGLEIFCDDRQLSQVFMNLMTNSLTALKDTTHKRRKILIRANKEPNNKIVITFLDNGKGIKEKDKPKIFDINYSTKAEWGSGFGLAICKNIIVEIMEGEISVESKYGFFTKFNINIPTD